MQIDDIFFAAIEDIERLETIDAGKDVLTSLREKYNLANVVYHSPRSPGQTSEGPFLLLTYPEEWVRHYISKNYFTIDPIVREGFGRAIPLDWDTVDLKSASEKRFFGEAAEAGVGRHGMSFAVRTPSGNSALLSITSDAGDREWKNDRLMIARDFQLIAHYMHGKFNELLGIGTKAEIRLAPRELECLQWSAEGKTISDVAVILNLSERTVRLYLDTARYKLNCLNKTHAVAKALSLGMICYTDTKSTFNTSLLPD